jgi:hypothetical protein
MADDAPSPKKNPSIFVVRKARRQWQWQWLAAVAVAGGSGSGWRQWQWLAVVAVAGGSGSVGGSGGVPDADAECSGPLPLVIANVQCRSSSTDWNPNRFKDC